MALTHTSKNLEARVFGIGVNDVDYPISYAEGRVRRILPSYQMWRGLLGRCYSKDSLIRHPTYQGCSVSEDWHRFSIFALWYTNNHKPQAVLDKDLLVPGNRVYGPETCVFISQSLNNLLLLPVQRKSAKLGAHPLGDKFTSSYSAQGRQVYLGIFNTATEAHKAYQLAKATEFARAAEAESDIRVREALNLRSSWLLEAHRSGLETTNFNAPSKLAHT